MSLPIIGEVLPALPRITVRPLTLATTLATILAMAKKTDPQGGEDEIRQGGQLVEA